MKAINVSRSAGRGPEIISGGLGFLETEHLVGSARFAPRHKFSVHSLSSPQYSLSFPGSGWLQTSSCGRTRSTCARRLLLSLYRDCQTLPENNVRGYPEDEKYRRKTRHPRGGSLEQRATVLQPIIHGIRKGLPVPPQN